MIESRMDNGAPGSTLPHRVELFSSSHILEMASPERKHLLSLLVSIRIDKRTRSDQRFCLWNSRIKGQRKRESENMAKSPKQRMVHGLLLD